MLTRFWDFLNILTQGGLLSTLTDVDYDWAPSAYPNVQSKARLSTFDTTNGTEQSATSVPIADESYVDAIATVQGRSEDNKHFRLDLRCAYKRTDAGAPTIVDAPSSSNALSTGNPAGWSARFAVSGNDLHVYVTGAAATNIRWTVNLNTQVDLLDAAAPAAFDRTAVAIPMTLWITPRAPDVTIAAGEVTAFNNKATPANDPTITVGEEPQYTAANAAFGNQPTFKCVAGTGTQVVRADPAAHGLTTGPFTIVIVGRCKNSNYALGDPNGGTLILGGGGTGDKWQMTGDAATYLASSGGIADSPSVLICKFDGASSAIWVNGVKTSGNAGTTADLSALNLMIGNYGSPSSTVGADGDMGEVLMYSGGISDADATYLSNGLATEYGL